MANDAPNLTGRDLATVLAALRFYRSDGHASSLTAQDIAVDGGGEYYDPMTDGEIDALCDRLNFKPIAPVAVARVWTIELTRTLATYDSAAFGVVAATMEDAVRIAKLRIDSGEIKFSNTDGCDEGYLKAIDWEVTGADDGVHCWSEDVS